MSYFLWGCRGILTLITLRGERVNFVISAPCRRKSVTPTSLSTTWTKFWGWKEIHLARSNNSENQGEQLVIVMLQNLSNFHQTSSQKLCTHQGPITLPSNHISKPWALPRRHSTWYDSRFQGEIEAHAGVVVPVPRYVAVGENQRGLWPGCRVCSSVRQGLCSLRGWGSWAVSRAYIRVFSLGLMTS